MRYLIDLIQIGFPIFIAPTIFSNFHLEVKYLQNFEFLARFLTKEGLNIVDLETIKEIIDQKFD